MGARGALDDDVAMLQHHAARYCEDTSGAYLDKISDEAITLKQNL